MSLSKEFCLRSDSQNRQSFSDRICDDLCEEILQYLSLEDKLKLEGVSKQFQRTIFQQQNELYINMRGPKEHIRHLIIKDLRIRRDFNYYYIEDQSLYSFEALLKKCPNITLIQLNGYNRGDPYYNPNKINQIFRLIIENCDNLREVILSHHMNDRIFEEFHQKFGPKLKYFSFVRKLVDLSLFPNIEKVEMYNVHDDSIFQQLKLDKFKQLMISINQGQEHMFQTFIDNFSKITHFSVNFWSGNENAISKSLKNISNLKHLIHFAFHMFGENNNIFYSLLKQMANNCQNLKSIECNFNIEQNSDIRQLLSQMITFPALKRLKLRFDLIYNEGEDNIEFSVFSFELFKGFSNITHLSLYINRRLTLKESILKDIDINLPNLQYLEIDYPFDTTPEGVTQMADILSRLSRLQTIRFIFFFGINFKPFEEQITKNCRKIRKIKIN